MNVAMITFQTAIYFGGIELGLMLVTNSKT